MFWKALDVLFKKVSQRYGPKIKTVETTKVKVIFGLKMVAILDFGSFPNQNIIFFTFFLEMGSWINLEENKMLIGGFPDITLVPNTPISIATMLQFCY